jgi:hypothetical protein
MAMGPVVIIGIAPAFLVVLEKKSKAVRQFHNSFHCQPRQRQAELESKTTSPSFFVAIIIPCLYHPGFGKAPDKVCRRVGDW